MTPIQTTPIRQSPALDQYFFLEAIQNPAILVDIKQSSIQGANQRFLSLVKYSKEELTTQNPTDIITEFLGESGNSAAHQGGVSRLCSVIDKTGTKHPTKLRQFPFSSHSSMALYIFQPLLNNKDHSYQLDLEAVSSLLYEMMNRADKHDRPSSIIKSIKTITQSKFVAYYKKTDAGLFDYVTAYGSFEDLPSQINDVANVLLVPRIWETTTQVIDIPELEAVIGHLLLGNLVTYPIIDEGNHTGILLLGITSAVVKENILKLLRTLVNVFTHPLFEEKNQYQDNSYTKEFAGEQSSIQEIIEDGIIILSPDLNIRDMNPAAQNYLGYSLDEALDKPFDTILTNIDLIRNALHLALQGIATHDMPALNLHRRNGDLFSAQVKVYPVLQSESVYSILVVIRDISEYDKIVERARQLEQRAWLGNLTAIFAHEVRNPINNIKTGLQLMAVSIPEDSEDQETISRLINDCNRLNNLMEATLNYSRFGTYKFEFVDVVEMLNKILSHWKVKFVRANVVSNTKTTTSKTTVYGDKRALDQVFQNIISNALRVMSKQGGGVLSLHVQSEEILPGKEMVKIELSDTGPGIPDDVKEHIFDPFFTTNPDGTGLGLAITKQIITAHKGAIEVDSFPGGTVFKISLPYRSSEHDSNGTGH